MNRHVMAVDRLKALEVRGYRFEPAGQCIRVWYKDSCRYVMVHSIMDAKYPEQYVEATFADRW